MSLKEIKGRINSVKSTQKITSAMRMVSSAKLHRTQGRAQQTLAYAAQLRQMASNLAQSLKNLQTEDDSLEQKSINRVALILVGSNSGLCGAFNSNLWKYVQARRQYYQSLDIQMDFYPMSGKVAHELSKAGISYEKSYIGLAETFTQNPGPETQQPVLALLQKLLDQYQQGEIDRVEVLYTHFRSMGTQILDTQQLVPFVAEETQDESSVQSVDYLIEPNTPELLSALRARLLRARFLSILFDAATAEHASRMMAMQTADDNAQDLLQTLTLQYNKTRQQSITNELIDIMSGRLNG